MRSTRDFLTGIITGIAIGMLTAPRSGKETRDKLVDEANKRSEDLKDQWSKGVEQVKQGYEQAKTQVNQYTQQAKDQINQYKDKAQSEANQQQAKQQYNDQVDNLANKAESGIEDARDAVRVN